MKPGDLVLYKRRGCDVYELGVVKSMRDDGAFVWYSGGDTAAATPADCLFEFENDARAVVEAHAVSGSYDRLHALADELDALPDGLPPAFRDFGSDVARRVREALRGGAE